MKTLILLRHGKSDWSVSVPDHGRPINRRGRDAAVRMAQWMAGEGLTPDHMLVSSAVRTQQTAERLLSVWGDVAKVSLKTLYLADPDTILGAIRSQGKGDTLLVLGHNPGLERMAAHLSRDPCPPDMPTCAAAVQRLSVSRWSDVAYGTGELLHHVTPKSLA